MVMIVGAIAGTISGYFMSQAGYSMPAILLVAVLIGTAVGLIGAKS